MAKGPSGLLWHGRNTKWVLKKFSVDRPLRQTKKQTVADDVFDFLF